MLVLKYLCCESRKGAQTQHFSLFNRSAHSAGPRLWGLRSSSGSWSSGSYSYSYTYSYSYSSGSYSYSYSSGSWSSGSYSYSSGSWSSGSYSYSYSYTYSYSYSYSSGSWSSGSCALAPTAEASFSSSHPPHPPQLEVVNFVLFCVLPMQRSECNPETLSIAQKTSNRWKIRGLPHRRRACKLGFVIR